jgi:undecaprenyl-phosphate 4-deoxy-4-formamido-L-arabinose transferase
MGSTVSEAVTPTPDDHEISVVIPVYRGAAHLGSIVAELESHTKSSTTPEGRPYRVVEVVLVNDCGPDDSDRVMRELEQRHDWVRPVWLSRNYGQHAATIAGMASAGGEWIVTMDEDGQHDPADMGNLLDAALRERRALVYARPVNQAPHSAFRRVTSRLSKRFINALSGGSDASLFHSYRLVLGEYGRSVAAYAGHGIYLDVALNWVAGHPATAPVTLRDEGERVSGYSARTLMSHFWRMVVTSGTRGLRMVSVLGATFAGLGIVLATGLAIARIAGNSVLQGWTSLMVALLLCTGVILFFLGVIAEYVGVAVNMAMGKPLYLIIGDPGISPLSRGDERVVERPLARPGE